MVLLRGNFHIPPLGHGPIPEQVTHKNFKGLNAEIPSIRYKTPRLQEIEHKVRLILNACLTKGLDFYANTDHVINTSRTAQRIITEENLPITLIPGFEADPISSDPELNHILVLGVPPQTGETLTGLALRSLRRLADKHNGILIAAHPRRDLFWQRANLQNIYDGYETYNSGFDPPTFTRDTKLTPVSNTDAHNPTTLVQRPNHNLVNAKSNTPEDILQAIREGNNQPINH